MRYDMKWRFALWCCAWVDLAASIFEILTLGFTLTQWRLRAAKFFAFRNWIGGE